MSREQARERAIAALVMFVLDNADEEAGYVALLDALRALGVTEREIAIAL